MRLLLVALLVLLTPHVADAGRVCPSDEGVYLCSADHAYGSSDCAEEGTSGGAWTAFLVGSDDVATVFLVGSSQCEHASGGKGDQTSSMSSIAIYASSPAGYVGASWSGAAGQGTCGLGAWGGSPATDPVGAATPCPSEAAPPNPGWGHLLP